MRLTLGKSVEFGTHAPHLHMQALTLAPFRQRMEGNKGADIFSPYCYQAVCQALHLWSFFNYIPI